MPDRQVRVPRGNAAPFSTDPYIPQYSKQQLLNPTLFDSILRNEGHTNYHDHVALLDTYESLIRDCHVSATLNYRISDVVRRGLKVTPWNDEDPQSVVQAEFIKDMLLGLGTEAEDVEEGEALITTGAQGFDALVENLLHSSLLTGFGAAEIIWMPGQTSEILKRNNLILPYEVRVRKPRRFGFKIGDQGYVPRLITRENRLYGQPIKPRKFIFHHHQIMRGPYGLGLGHQLYWPVILKRENLTFWAVFNERFGSPTTVVKYPLDASSEEIESVQDAVNSISQEGNVAIPETFALELLEAMRSGSITTYMDFNRWCDEQISECILGQTGTTNQSGSGGSRAQDEVAERVSIRIAKRDADLLGRTLQQTIVRWTLQTNFGFDTRLPSVSWAFPELDERIDLDTASLVDERLTNMTGRKLEIPYLEEKYDVEFGDEAVAPAIPIVPPAQDPETLAQRDESLELGELNTSGVLEAVPDPLDRPIQDEADDLAANALAQTLPMLSNWETMITEMLSQAENYSEFQDKLFAMFDELDDTTLQRVLSDGMAIAEAIGTESVQEER